MTTKELSQKKLQKFIALEKILKGMGHRTRLAILILSIQSKEGATPSEIKDVLRLNKKTYDFHIKTLKLLNLIDVKKKNEQSYFYATQKAVQLLRQLELI